MARNGFDPNGERRELSGWLGEQEDNHRLVLFEADSEDTDWTKLCISQADCILSIVAADAGPELGQYSNETTNSARCRHNNQRAPNDQSKHTALIN